MNIKLSRVSFFLFLFSFNYLWLRIIVFNFFYNYFGNMSWIYSLVLCFLILIILIFIPKKLFTIDYEKNYLKSKIKHLYNLFLSLEVFLGIVISSYILGVLFISDLKMLSLIIALSIVIGIISLNKPSDIIQLSTIFLIFGLGLMLLSYIYFIDFDLSLLFPMEMKNMISLSLFIFLIIGNNLSILLMDKKNFELKKSLFIIPIILAIIILGLELLILTLSAGTELFKNVMWVGFVSVSIKPVAKYVGNFDFAYIIYILICCIFKFAYNFSVIRNSYKMNNKKMNVLYSIIIGIGAGLVYFFIPFDNTFMLASVGVILLQLIIAIWYFKEYYYVRKVKEK